jgi:hypothetical protein
MRLSNIRSIGRYCNVKTGKFHNFKTGRYFGRANVFVFYTYQNKRHIVSDADIGKVYLSIDKMARSTKPVDLRLCKKGDILISRHGAILRYVKPTDEDFMYNKGFTHLVKYDKNEVLGIHTSNSHGTRTNDGRVFVNKSLPEDHDIAFVIYLENKTNSTTGTSK